MLHSPLHAIVLLGTILIDSFHKHVTLGSAGLEDYTKLSDCPKKENNFSTLLTLFPLLRSIFYVL